MDSHASELADEKPKLMVLDITIQRLGMQCKGLAAMIQEGKVRCVGNY